MSDTVSLKRKRGLDDGSAIARTRASIETPASSSASPPATRLQTPVPAELKKINDPVESTSVLGENWTVLNDEIVSKFDGEVEQILDLVRTLITAPDSSMLSIFLYEIVLSAIIERIKMDTTLTVLNKARTLDLAASAGLDSLLVDVLSAFEFSSALGTILRGIKVDRSLYKLRLEPQVLVASGLENQMFGRQVIRANTSIIYKQKRFNLLREESEGYAKLVVEVHSASYAPHSMSLVNSTTRNIISIIGYFDLDPNRALDIFLDVFAVNMVANCPFFLALLKSSPWWPRRTAIANSIEEVNVGGNALAASLLGFKLQSYVTASEPVPDNLIMLVAVLVKEGFICLADIYSHVAPSDADMLAEKDRWKKDLEQTAYMVTASALALAAPLADDTAPSNDRNRDKQQPEKEEQQEKKNDIPLQKAQLVSSLLAVGAIWPALFILSKFPFLAGAFPDVADVLNIIISHAITPFYESIRPFKPVINSSENVKRLPAEHARQLSLVTPKPASTRRVLSPLKRSERADTAYRFFYDSWANGINQVETVDDLVYYSDLLIKYSGSFISRDSILFTKLCRIVNHFLNEYEKTKNLPDVQPKYDSDFWLHYFRTYLLPAIALFDPNPGVMHELAGLLFHYDYPVRYSVYGEWYTVLLKNQPELRVAAAKAEKETKNILKRLSKTNTREMMRQLARVSIANPITSLMALVSQVESYDNLSALVVEAARYFTPIGWDALPFVIMMQLTSGRGTVQLDGVTERQWLQSLASFTAKLCKEYSMMSPTPLLQYLQRQLHKSNSSDILLLQELMQQMAGIESMTNLTDAQLEGLSGGRRIRSEVLIALGDKRHISKKSATRLLSSLVNLNLVSELFVLLAQQYKTAIFTMPEYQAHTKILGARYDDLAVILSQYIELLNTFLLYDGAEDGVISNAKFEELMIDIPVLCNDFGVDPVVAFSVWREKLGLEIREYDDMKWKERIARREREKEEERNKGETAGNVTNGEVAAKATEDVEMVDARSNEDSKTGDVISDDDHVKKKGEFSGEIEIAGVKQDRDDAEKESKLTVIMEAEVEQVLDAEDDENEEIWNPLLKEIMEKLSPIPAISGPWKYITKGLFVTFWQLSLYDIQIPGERYKSEQGRLREAIRQIDADKSDKSSHGFRKRQQEREELLQIVTKLNAEYSEQLVHYEHTRHRLRIEKDHWFRSINAMEDIGSMPIRDYLPPATDAFLSTCILPRALFSPVDATFCAKFIKVMHSMSTYNFSTSTLFDRLFSESIFAIIVSCTPAEAENLGRFMNDIFAELASWHADKKIYERDCVGRREVSGKVKFLLGFSRTNEHYDVDACGDLDKETTEYHLLTYSETRRLIYKWHHKLRAILIACLESQDYMHRRNAIIILKNMSRVFPKVVQFGRSILERVETMSKQEERDDLKLAATTLFGIMKRQSANWVDSSLFRFTEEERKDQAERKAKEEVERKAKEEVERKAKEEAERKAKEEVERKAKEEAEKKPKVETDAVEAAAIEGPANSADLGKGPPSEEPEPIRVNENNTTSVSVDRTDAAEQSSKLLRAEATPFVPKSPLEETGSVAVSEQNLSNNVDGSTAPAKEEKLDRNDRSRREEWRRDRAKDKDRDRERGGDGDRGRNHERERDRDRTLERSQDYLVQREQNAAAQENVPSFASRLGNLASPQGPPENLSRSTEQSPGPKATPSADMPAMVQSQSQFNIHGPESSGIPRGPRSMHDRDQNNSIVLSGGDVTARDAPSRGQQGWGMRNQVGSQQLVATGPNQIRGLARGTSPPPRGPNAIPTTQSRVPLPPQQMPQNYMPQPEMRSTRDYGRFFNGSRSIDMQNPGLQQVQYTILNAGSRDGRLPRGNARDGRTGVLSGGMNQTLQNASPVTSGQQDRFPLRSERSDLTRQHRSLGSPSSTPAPKQLARQEGPGLQRPVALERRESGFASRLQPLTATTVGTQLPPPSSHSRLRSGVDGESKSTDSPVVPIPRSERTPRGSDEPASSSERHPRRRETPSASSVELSSQAAPASESSEKLTEREWDRERDREKDRDRDKDGDRGRERRREPEKDRDKERGRHGDEKDKRSDDQSSHHHKHRSERSEREHRHEHRSSRHQGSREGDSKDKDKEKDRKERDKEKSRDRDRHRDRDRERERDKEKDRERRRRDRDDRREKEVSEGDKSKEPSERHREREVRRDRDSSRKHERGDDSSEKWSNEKRRRTDE
ncbi:transcription factor/nuclear export subunit protein 2-domain-containing protein [Lipomyces chichibuensis]|uniref:transcription factor/nuclear export subunit protein 2-domain-containing protein n=1 Tax=Lipomyces chichibuensis TaxID=1546026 RepID=UPI003343971E